VGDAFAFVDPVFSSGVYLAMNSAFLGADVVDACLRNPRAAPRLQRRFNRTVRRGLRGFSWMIYRMTSPTIRDMFMAPADALQLRSGVISFLAGDVFQRGPAYGRLLVFRALYYLLSLASLRTSLGAWLRRRRAIKPVEETA